MRQLLGKLWSDDRGALIASEYLFVATVLVLGIVVGLADLRTAISVELTELGNAILALSQGYSVNGLQGDGGGIDGSQAFDTPGLLTNPTLTPPAIPSFIDVYPAN